MTTESIFNFDGYHVPEHTQGALERYLTHGLEPGSFLTAVLTNDLFGAVNRADTWNSQSLADIVKWLYNEAPRGSFGDEELVKAWLNRGPAFEEFNKQLVVDILSN
jgi:hypothetical protein